MSKPKFKLDQEVKITYKDNSVCGYIYSIHTIKYSEDDTKYFYKVCFSEEWIINHKTGKGKLVSKSVLRAEEFISKIRPNKNEE